MQFSNHSMENQIVARTSKIELEGEMNVAASYRFTIALLGAETEALIKAGKTTIDREIQAMQSNPDLMDKKSADFMNKVLLSDDKQFREQLIDLLEAVFGELPEEHFIEKEGDSSRTINRKRNNQINAMVAITSFMKEQAMINVEDDDFEDNGNVAILMGKEDDVIEVTPEEVPVAGIPDEVAKMGMIDLNALDPAMREQILRAIADGQKIKGGNAGEVNRA